MKLNIENSTINTVLNGSDNDDVILNWGGGTTILGGAGNDSIQSSTIHLVDNRYGHVTIDAGDGDDTINNYDPRVSINAGAGNDSINVWEWNEVTVRGGTGDDTITGTGEGKVIEYASGDGNDVILGYDDDDLIRLVDGSNYTTQRSGDDAIISVGSGSITIKNIGDNELNIIRGNVDAVSINNSSINTLLGGTPFDDTLINYAGGTTIHGGAGNDYIYSSTLNTLESGYGFVTIDAGSGNDTILSEDPYVSLDGGSGDDFIYTPGDYPYITIKAGKGDDTLLGDSSLGGARVYLFASDDGDDVFVNFSSNDLIAITDNSTYTAAVSGDDIIVYIGDGSIRLVNGTSRSINIVGGESVNAATLSENILSINEDSPTLNTSRSNVTIIGSDTDDSIVNSGQHVSIVESNGFNTIINFGTSVTVEGGDYDDLFLNSGARVSIGGGNGDDTLVTSADSTLTGNFGSDLFRIALTDSVNGINVDITDLSSVDALAFLSSNTTGFDFSVAGDNMIMTDNTGLIKVTLDGINSVDPVSSVAVELRNSGGILQSTTTLGDLATLGGTEIAEGVKLNASGKTLKIKTPFTGTIRAADYGDKVKTINAASDQNPVVIIGNDLNNIIKASKGGSTITGGGGKDKITCGKGADLIICSDGDGNDVVKKFDTTQDKIQLASGTIDSVKIKGKNVLLSIGDGSLTVQKAVGQELTIIDADGVESAYVFTKQNADPDSARISSNAQLPDDLLYSDDEFSNFTVGSVLTGTDGDDTLQNYAGGSTVLGGDGNDSIISITFEDFLLDGAGYGYVTIDGGDGNDTIISHDPHVSINGGAGNDVIETNAWDYVTVRGGAGNDSITGSDHSSAVYQYARGDGYDIIVGFDSSDIIQLLDNSEYKTLLCDSDVVVSLESGSITLKDAINQVVNIVVDSGDSVNCDGVKLNKSGKTLKIKAPFAGTVRAEDFGDHIKTINAASDPNAVEIVGNDLNNVIKASKGGSTISGGLGNDKITCGKGADLIVYTGGNDVVKRFDAMQDTIRLADGVINDVRIKGKNVVLSIGEGSLTVQKMLGQELTIVDADGEESTYVFTKQNTDLNSARITSNAELPAYWFDQDTADDPLGEIMSSDAPGVQSFNRTNDLNAAVNITAEYAISTAIDPIAGSAPQFRHRNN